MNRTRTLSRRSLLRHAAGSGAALAAGGSLAGSSAAADKRAAPRLKGRINHSVCLWSSRMPLEELCKAAKAIGIRSIDLLGPKDWPTLKKYGLTCAMANGAGMGIDRGFNRVEYHDKLVEGFEALIPKAAAAGLENVICMSGNRGGISDEEGLENCVKGLKRPAPIAEKHKITVCLELLNSKRNHKDYMADHTAWGVEVCKRVGSERLKLLYDIYHMQIMEGDIIDTIRENHPYIGHYHTGGVPGRHEIDDTQEINYPAVMKAIVATGYKGFVAQEFIPRGPDPLASLRKAIQICDV